LGRILNLLNIHHIVTFCISNNIYFNIILPSVHASPKE
jgi:hypothetical protein